MGWGSTMIYGTMLGPSLLTIPISPHHSAIRLSSSLGPGERESEREREAPSGLRMKDCLARNPVRGLWRKDLTDR